MSLPFASSLLIARFAGLVDPSVTPLLGLVPGGSILTVLYWRYVLAKSIRDEIASAARWSRGSIAGTLTIAPDSTAVNSRIAK